MGRICPQWRTRVCSGSCTRPPLRCPCAFPFAARVAPASLALALAVCLPAPCHHAPRHPATRPAASPLASCRQDPHWLTSRLRPRGCERDGATPPSHALLARHTLNACTLQRPHTFRTAYAPFPLNNGRICVPYNPNAPTHNSMSRRDPLSQCCDARYTQEGAVPLLTTNGDRRHKNR